MKHSDQLKKIIWAIDVLGEEKLQLNVAKFLSNFAAPLKVEIWPVFVMSLAGLPGLVDRKAFIDHLPKMEEILHAIIKKSGLRVMPEKILMQTETGFTRNDVKTLLTYANSIKAQAIVVGTHAKKGVARFFLGSFAETLLLNTTIPIITINPLANIVPKIRTILFATDFTPESQIAFKSVVALARQLQAKVLLFHQHLGYKEEIEPNVLLPKKGKWPLAKNEFVQKSLRESTVKAMAWQKVAKKNGVQCTSHFAYGIRNIADAVNQTATKLNINMIALASSKGPLSTAFIGSTARWLVRSASCPVWVLHASKK